jgi:hypothetical protein
MQSLPKNFWIKPKITIPKMRNQALQLTQKASFVLYITLRVIFAQNKGCFLGI